MSEPSEDKQTISDPGWHELVDDAFGINLKGLKTIWASITDLLAYSPRPAQSTGKVINIRQPFVFGCS